MRCGTVAYVGMKTIRYGTVITPNVVKDVLGALPEEQLTAVSRQTYLKNTRFLKPVTKIEDGRYPSVSTILGCTTSQRSLYHWQLKMIKQLGGIGAFKKHIRGRMMIGTQYHSCVQRILGEFKNRRSFPDNVAEEVICTVDACVGSYVNSVLPILRTFANNNMELERHTSHHGLCYNGRFDATVTYKDALFLMDWKTVSSGSTKDNCVEIEKMYNDPLQLAAYIGAVNSDSNFKTLPEIRCGAIVIAKEDGSVADVVEMSASHLEVYWIKWLECVRQFWTEMENRSAVNDVISFVCEDKRNY